VTPAGLPAEGSILKQVGHHTIDCIEALRIFFVRKTWLVFGLDRKHGHFRIVSKAE